MLDILVVRHGQTDWNAIQRVMGRKDIPLNEIGRAQAAVVRDWLTDIPLDAVYTSPVLRAKQTTEIILEGKPNLTLQEEEGLAEINYGDWIGKLFFDVHQEFKESYEAYLKNPSRLQIPGGERVSDVQKRVVAVVEKVRKKHEGGKILLVSHADLIKMIFVHYLGISLDHIHQIGCANGSLSIYRFGGEWGDRLVALNYFADMRKMMPW